MDVENLNLSLQRFLKKSGHYDGSLDGKFGPGSYDAVALYLRSININPKGWNKSRLKTAAEQAFYRSLSIETGIVDGFEGHLLEHARDVYKAKLTINWRDEAEVLAQEVPPKAIVVKSTGKVTPLREWPRQKECTSFYGRVGTNQADCELPYPFVIAWNPKQKIHKYSCHKLVKAPMERIWKRVFDHYGHEKIKELKLDRWGGCLNVRKMRGGSSYSMHSWGIAVDMDPDNNQLKWGRDRATFSKSAYKKYWEFVYDEGAISLGIERNYDWMHYQFARL